MRPRFVAFTVTAAFALAFDQLTKIWARHVLLPIYPRVARVIPGYWEMRYSENPGAAFGFLRNVPGALYFFSVIAVAISIGAIFYLRKTELRHPWRVGAWLGFVVGGALGNAFDRVAFHHVTDFVVWKIGTHEWDTFNVADAALVVGIAGLLLDSRPAKADGKAARAV
ncbi:MAG: peptidase [Myxococcales bacterium]|nr:peptidase [Myxococcales bacterium]